MRNFESLKTAFSVFCREDYRTDHTPSRFLDVGANVGIASAYFLTRHGGNRVECYEPDSANLPVLRRNMEQFSGRVSIRECGIAEAPGEIAFFRSEDGKYSSMIESEKAAIPVRIRCVALRDELQAWRDTALPLTLKLDVEGMELALVRSVEWERFPAVRRLICESTECSAAISRPHVRRLRSGYVEDLEFADRADSDTAQASLAQ